MTSMTTAAVGRHSELLAITALLANGYTVLEPAVPEPFDLAITRRGESKIIRIQVKTLQYLEKDGHPWYKLKAKKNSGVVYAIEDCDVFIGVAGMEAYMFENNGKQGEYWCKPDELSEKWTRLTTRLEHAQTNDSPNESEAI